MKATTRPVVILEVESQDDPRLVDQAMPSMISSQASVNVAGGYGTSVAHTLARAFDDPTMDEDLRTALAAHEIEMADEWADVE